MEKGQTVKSAGCCGLMQRSWRFRDHSEKNETLIERLQKETGLSFLTLKVCLLRGLDTAQAIREFLSPELGSLADPMSLKGMDRAVERLVRVRNAQQKLRIFGDYDVDGTAATALLLRVFREFGFTDVDACQPDRFADGYGLNVKAVEKAVEDGVSVLVTVDCGITSFQACSRAWELGLDVLVLDHHQVDPDRGIPQAWSVVNPQQFDCPSGLKQLCGCGVAFYLARALRSEGHRQGWFAEGKVPNLKQHLDLVVMATAADMVPLVGDNHILVRHGLEVLKKTKKPGIQALLEEAGLAFRDFSPSFLGFVLAPRINASGRIQSASLALELLTSQDSDRTRFLAQELERCNATRVELQNSIWDSIRLHVSEQIARGRFRHAVVVAHADWHEGVVGIVASRVSETFQRPSVVISMRKDFGKASVRSFGGKDVLHALRACSSYLLSFGGHRYAAGLSVHPDQLEAFEKAFDEAVGLLKAEENDLLLEGPCSLEDLDGKTLREIESLGPFGPGHPEPIFTIEASVSYHRVLKERHLKLGLSHAKNSIEAIWFNAMEREDVVADELSGQVKQWAGVPELNRFQGRVTPTFRVRDWR
jgi:single-stranded-DNA-specific exonuclease